MSEDNGQVIAAVRNLLNDLALQALHDRVRIHAVLELLDGMNVEPAPVNEDDDAPGSAGDGDDCSPTTGGKKSMSTDKDEALAAIRELLDRLQTTEPGRERMRLHRAPRMDTSRTKVTNRELQEKVLEFAEAAILHYAEGSGAIKPPEHFVPNVVASRLIDEGFLIYAEPSATDISRFHLHGVPLDPDLTDFLDLLVYDPSPDGNSRHATPRAVMKFKISPFRIANGVRLTVRLVNRFVQARNDATFGFVVAGGAVYTENDAEEKHRRALEEVSSIHEPGCQPFLTRTFDIPFVGMQRRYGQVIGVPILPLESSFVRFA